MDFSIYPQGVKRNAPRISLKCEKLPCEKRGKIKGFSSHSRLRLRSFLLFRYIPGLKLYGVTLTIPAQDDMETVIDRFSVAVHRLRVYFLRRFQNSGFVWRVELQCNRMPHLHLVAYVSPSIDVVSRFLRLWSDIVLRLFVVDSLSAFMRHGVVVQELDGNIRAFRYLCDHGSKRKQAQLGWRGRQWGVVGRESFIIRDRLQVTLDGTLLKMFNRFLRRVAAFSVPYEKHGCPFGRKIVKCRNDRAVSYVSNESVIRWLEHYDLPI